MTLNIVLSIIILLLLIHAVLHEYFDGTVYPKPDYSSILCFCAAPFFVIAMLSKAVYVKLRYILWARKVHIVKTLDHQTYKIVFSKAMRRSKAPWKDYENILSVVKRIEGKITIYRLIDGEYVQVYSKE